jgi:hypothetical protein
VKDGHCRNERRLIACLVALLFIVFAFSHEGHRSSNSLSRLYVLCSLISESTLKIDRYQEGTKNVAAFEGHFYSDKPPGTALLALPAFLFSHYVLGLQIPSTIGEPTLALSWVTTVGSAGIIAALGGGFLYAWLRQRLSSRIALWTTLGVFLGGPPMLYATMLYPHGIVVGLLSAALWCIDRPSQPQDRVCQRDFTGGVLLGLAMASEPSSCVIIAGILCMNLRQGCCIKWFCLLGLIIPVMALPAYGWACFNDPFTLGYSFTTHVNMHDGLYGITIPPKFDNIWQLLFGSARGLLFWSPFLILALVGFHHLYITDKLRFFVSYVTIFSFYILMSGFNDWMAGPSFGSRLLSPLLPMLALPVGLGFQRFQKVGIILIVISMVLMVGGTFISPNPGREISNPVFETFVPSIRSESYATNVGQLLGLRGHWSFLPLLLLVGSLVPVLYRYVRSHEDSARYVWEASGNVLHPDHKPRHGQAPPQHIRMR